MRRRLSCRSTKPPARRTIERPFATHGSRSHGRSARRVRRPPNLRFERMIEMRYRGQRHNVKVAVPAGADAAAVRDAFDARLPAPVRTRRPDDPGRISGAAHLGVRTSGTAGYRPSCRAPRPRPRAAEKRPVTSAAVRRPRSDVYDRYALRPGYHGAGPAVLEEYGSTTVVWPGDRFTIGALYEIRIDCTPKEHSMIAHAPARRSDHARSDPARPRFDHQPNRREHHPDRLQPLHL